MDKYDAFQSAYAADLGVLGNSLQRWLVRIDHDCQTSWRDRLTRAWVARTVHNIFLAVKAVSYSRRAEVFDFLRTATQRRTREPIGSCPRANGGITRSCTFLFKAFHGRSCDVESVVPISSSTRLRCWRWIYSCQVWLGEMFSRAAFNLSSCHEIARWSSLIIIVSLRHARSYSIAFSIRFQAGSTYVISP
jgi:hypothetical protein